jgi:hypothetical protein
MADFPGAMLTTCCLHFVLCDTPRHSISDDSEADDGQDSSGTDMGDDGCAGDEGEVPTPPISFSLSLEFTDNCVRGGEECCAER